MRTAPLPPGMPGASSVGLRDDAPPDRWPWALQAPGILVLLAGGLLGVIDGGYPETVWYPAALFLLALFVLVLLVAPPSATDRSPFFDAALVALGLLTAWSYLSMLWADLPGDAWEAANRTLLIWLALAVAGLRPWPARAARLGVALVAFGLAAAAAGMLIATTSGDPVRLFVQGRLSDPTGYANATSNLWLVAFWPALHLAIARDVRWWLRGPALGAAVLLVQVALLSQSRGAVLAFCFTAVVFVVLHPRRWPAILALGAVAGLLALAWGTLLDVRSVDSRAALESALSDARRAIVLCVVVAIALGIAGALIDARTRVSRGLGRAGDRVVLFGVAGAAVLAVFVLALSPGWVDARWQDFRSSGYSRVEDGSSRFGGSLGSGRYDFYRVALNEFADHPVTGIGAGQFAVPYLQHRRTGEAPRYPHSLGIGVISQLGLVGIALFVAWIALACAAYGRVRMRGTAVERGLATGAFGGFVMFFSHAQVDWLWEHAALPVLAMGLLAIACRTGRPPGPPATAPHWPLRAWIARAAVGLVAVAAAISLVLPAAAARFERSAVRAQRTDRALTLKRFDRAADLDPLSADPVVSGGVVARVMGRIADARSRLQEGVRREPKNWFAHFELGLLEGQQRRWGPAARELAVARALNPRQPVIGDVQGRIRKRQVVDPAAAEAAITGQLNARLQPFD